MSDYKGIQGTAVQNFAGDPANPIDGQVWYDSANGSFKYFAEYPTGAWATAAPLNTARYQLTGCGATNTAALAFGGAIGPPTTNLANTESYNGSSWAEVNDLNLPRRSLGGAGIQTAALAFGGFTSPGIEEAETESWNGTTWTEVNDLNTARYLSAGAGTNTAALAIGGIEFISPASPPIVYANTESWNGTSWTEVNDLNTARGSLAGAGTQTAALAFGGGTPALTAVTESWNGTSWTEVNDLNTARNALAGAGIQTAALAFGGLQPAISVATESWNGSSWTNVNSMNLSQYYQGGAGTNTGALSFGGQTPAISATTQSWNAPYSATETITITI